MSVGTESTKPKLLPGQVIHDPVTRKIIHAGGVPKGGYPRKSPRLVKNAILKVFEKLGGIDEMYNWVNSCAKNRFAFYVHILPKVLSAQAIDEASAKLASRPPIGRIEHVIVDPKESYHGNMVEGEAVDVTPRLAHVEITPEDDEQPPPIPPKSMDEFFVREAFSQLAQDSGADENQARQFAGEIPL